MADNQQFICAQCGGLFEKQVPDDEAMAETTALFGPIAQEDCVLVCEECWKMMMVAMPPASVGNA